jgi:hypothetical protein
MMEVSAMMVDMETEVLLLARAEVGPGRAEAGSEPLAEAGAELFAEAEARLADHPNEAGDEVEVWTAEVQARVRVSGEVGIVVLPQGAAGVEARVRAGVGVRVRWDMDMIVMKLLQTERHEKNMLSGSNKLQLLTNKSRRNGCAIVKNALGSSSEPAMRSCLAKALSVFVSIRSVFASA